MMNIHRNQYEEYFLLYADGELDAAAMQAVEAFIAANPDLAPELQACLDARLADIPLTMPGKEELLKLEAWDAEAPTPLQIALLQLLEGQLGPEEALQLQTQIAASPLLQKEWKALQATCLSGQLPMEANARLSLVKLSPWLPEALEQPQQQMLDALEAQPPQMPAGLAADVVWQAEWNLLQKTKLEAEAITMPGKDKLLKPEGGSRTPVLPLQWRRWVAAAAVIVGLGWAVLQLTGIGPAITPDATGAEEQPIASQTAIPPAISNDAPLPAEPANADAQALVASTEPVTSAADKQPGQPAPDRPAPSQPLASFVLVQKTTPANEPEAFEPATASTHLPETAVADNLNLQQRLKPLPMSREEGIIDRPATFDAGNIAKRLPGIEAAKVPAPVASYASYTQMADEDDSDETETINIAGARVPKQKLRGLIRTVGRTIGRSFDKSQVESVTYIIVSELK